MNRRYKIFKDNPLRCKINKTLRLKIKELFQYDKTYWEHKAGWKGKSGVLRNQYSPFITGNDKTGGHFFMGSLPRVLKYCKAEGIIVKAQDMKKTVDLVAVEREPILPGITFRPDQLEAIEATKKNYFGRIIAPTRSGKTIVQLGIASQFPSKRILLLAHTKELIKQLGQEATKYSQKLPTVYTPGNVKEIESDLLYIDNTDSSCLMICTIQSLSKIPKDKLSHVFDIIMIDEAHHVNRPRSMYGKLLLTITTPRRYGFTATLPTEKAEELFNEGMLGDIVAELSVEEAMSKGIVATPRVEMAVVPYEKQINYECRTYKDYYQYGIIENESRHKLIADRVKLSLAFNNPTLIIIENIQHGQNIRNHIYRHVGIRIPFVKGKTNEDMKQARLNKIKAGRELITICSRVWMEGITMQNLEVVIYAAAMKEKKRILQAMGRGLGVTSSKTKITLMDFLDPYRYLAGHSVARQSVYIQEGWMKWI
jgi:superfamily II DNA or RNA helicase